MRVARGYREKDRSMRSFSLWGKYKKDDVFVACVGSKPTHDSRTFRLQFRLRVASYSIVAEKPVCANGSCAATLVCTFADCVAYCDAAS